MVTRHGVIRSYHSYHHADQRHSVHGERYITNVVMIHVAGNFEAELQDCRIINLT